MTSMIPETVRCVHGTDWAPNTYAFEARPELKVDDRVRYPSNDEDFGTVIEVDPLGHFAIVAWDQGDDDLDEVSATGRLPHHECGCGAVVLVDPVDSEEGK